MPTPQTPSMIQTMFNSLESPAKELTEWEQNFLESIQKQFARKRELSTAQFEILERLYAEKTE